MFGEKARSDMAPGGREGSAFSLGSAVVPFCAAVPFGAGLGVAFVLFRRRAIRLSWQAMQKMPCEVRA